jgi:uncharacterized membrane protein
MGFADYAMIIAIGLVSAVSQYLLKVGLTASVGGANISSDLGLITRALTNPSLLSAIALYVVAFVIYALLLVKSDVSQIFPATIGINILLVALMASFALGETITMPRLVGMAMIASGVYVVSRF